VKSTTRTWRTLLACTAAALAVSGVYAQDDALHDDTASADRWSALALIEPTVIPHMDSAGTYGLRMRLRYFDTFTGNVELRRHQYSPDDNLKMQHSRTSIAWSVRWHF
jgi:hypothetical protein